MTNEQWKRCNRCGNVLMGSEMRGETCNHCLDLGYVSMSDEDYDATQDGMIRYTVECEWCGRIEQCESVIVIGSPDERGYYIGHCAMCDAVELAPDGDYTLFEYYALDEGDGIYNSPNAADCLAHYDALDPTVRDAHTYGIYRWSDDTYDGEEIWSSPRVERVYEIAWSMQTHYTVEVRMTAHEADALAQKLNGTDGERMAKIIEDHTDAVLWFDAETEIRHAATSVLVDNEDDDDEPVTPTRRLRYGLVQKSPYAVDVIDLHEGNRIVSSFGSGLHTDERAKDTMQRAQRAVANLNRLDATAR